MFRLHTIFALTITLIVAPSIGILATMHALSHAKKLYFFSNTRLPSNHLRTAKTTRGWRGFFRFPLAFVLASAAVIGMAYLFNKVNPMIIYSSQYSVWASLLTTWWSVAWVILRGADKTKPSALARGYAWIHQWIFWFIIMVVVAVSIGKAGLASGYWVPVFYTGAFLSAWISLLELYALRQKGDAGGAMGGREHRVYSPEGHSQIAASSDDLSSGLEGRDDDQVNETTSLIRGPNRPSTFAYTQNNHHDAQVDDDITDSETNDIYGREQSWSKDLPDWTWILQFLLAVPLQIIFLGPIGLLIATALSQTGADGGGTLGTYLVIGVFSIFLLLPIGPFLHRTTYHITTLFFVVLVGTGIYNLAAFPFSPNARLKVYFQQTVDLQSGENLVHLVGHPDYIERLVLDYIPSARSESTVCAPDIIKDGLRRCSWKGASPKVAPTVANAVAPANGMADWIFYNITKLGDGKAKISLAGKNTRACKLIFHKPVTGIVVLNGNGEEQRNGNLSKSITHYSKTPVKKMHRSPTLGNPIPIYGTRELRLWSREWERGWDVEVTWETASLNSSTVSDEYSSNNVVHTELMAVKRTIGNANEDYDNTSRGGLDGRVVCLWSDANRDADEIPALEEVRRYLPVWAIASKLGELSFTRSVVCRDQRADFPRTDSGRPCGSVGAVHDLTDATEKMRMKITQADNHFALVKDFVAMHCFSRLSSQLKLLTYAAATKCFQHYYLSGREKRKLEAIRIRTLMYLPNSANIGFSDATSGFKLAFARSSGLDILCRLLNRDHRFCGSFCGRKYRTLSFFFFSAFPFAFCPFHSCWLDGPKKLWRGHCIYFIHHMYLCSNLFVTCPLRQFWSIESVKSHELRQISIIGKPGGGFRMSEIHVCMHLAGRPLQYPKVLYS